MYSAYCLLESYLGKQPLTSVQKQLLDSSVFILEFLCTTACNASHVLAIVEVSVCPSVHHTLALYQNGDT